MAVLEVDCEVVDGASPCPGLPALLDENCFIALLDNRFLSHRRGSIMNDHRGRLLLRVREAMPEVVLFLVVRTRPEQPHRVELAPAKDLVERREISLLDVINVQEHIDLIEALGDVLVLLAMHSAADLPVEDYLVAKLVLGHQDGLI